MALQISKELKEALYGDEAILKYIELGREHFQNGDRTALLNVVFLCARYQAVIPEWAVDELLRMEGNLDSGVAADLNDAFGWVSPRKGLREKSARQKKLMPLVLDKLQAHRLAGGGLNADLDLQEIANELSISRRDVVEIYKQHGQFIKDLPRSSAGNAIYARIHMTLPDHRRRGRSILHDQLKAQDTKSKNPVSD